MTFKQALIEGLKELLRVLLASAIVVTPIMIAQLEATGTVDWKVIGISALIGGLKAIDKLLHKWDGTKLKGLFQF